MTGAADPAPRVLVMGLGSPLRRSVRNHDPCISCATHFLRLEVDRG
jgi:coenzyme F420-reducing hydrogenase alpha subunit